MKIVWIILLTGVSATADCVGAEITNTVSFSARGLSFTNARVVRVEADGITVVDGTRGGKFAFESLPQEIRDRFGYEPTRAVLARNENDLAKAQVEAQRVAAWQVHHAAARSNRIAQTVMAIEGRVSRRLLDGSVVVSSGGEAMARARKHFHEMESRNNSRSRVVMSEAKTQEFSESGAMIFVGDCVVTHLPTRDSKAGAGETVNVAAYPTGSRMVGGKVYRVFTCRPERVAEIADEKTMEVLRAPRFPGEYRSPYKCSGKADCKVCVDCTQCEHCQWGGTCGRCR